MQSDVADRLGTGPTAAGRYRSVITDLRIYPVKGLRGHSVQSARVDPWGLDGDRRWLVIDEAGEFVTQRRFPIMATINANLMVDGLQLNADGRGDVRFPTPVSPELRAEVRIWKDRVSGMTAGCAAADWLTATIGTRCRLIYMDDPARARPLIDPVAPSDSTVSFADGYPVLLTTTGSLEALQAAAAPVPIEMDRFRSNIVVRTEVPWAEEGWTSIRCGNTEFAAAKPCARCVVITLDPETGERLPRGEPLRSLAGMRRDAKGRPIFGQNLVPLNGGELRVGDPVSATSGKVSR
ncbi:MOSC domain-containing protein [Sphingomonas sp. UYP23]